MISGIFDTHAHYDDDAFSRDRKELLSSLKEKGVVGVINCATDIATSDISLELAHSYDFIYAACGIHPEQAHDIHDGDFDKLSKHILDPKCVAVGEIGLDYHWKTVPKEEQLEVFERQLIIAINASMPVIIHDREAHADVMSLLGKYRPTGVLHCFSGSVELAKQAVEIGMYLGFGGSVTFKNAVKPVDVAKYCPQDRLLLETDCPYMAPVPMRGKRNDSSYISYTASRLSQIRECSPQKIADISRRNAIRLFCKCETGEK